MTKQTTEPAFTDSASSRPASKDWWGFAQRWTRFVLLIGSMPAYLFVLSHLGIRVGTSGFPYWEIPAATTGLAVLWHLVDFLRNDREFRELLMQPGALGLFAVPVGVAWLFFKSYSSTFAAFWVYGKWLLVGGEVVCVLMLTVAFLFERMGRRARPATWR